MQDFISSFWTERKIVKMKLKTLFEEKSEEYLERTKDFPCLYTDWRTGRDWSFFEKLTSDFRLHETRLDAIFRLVSDSLIGPKTLLDMGCNGGLLAVELAMEFPQAQIFAEDISRRQLQAGNVLREMFALENLVFRQQDATDTTTESYDVVVASELLEHFEFQSEAQNLIVTHAKESLKPDGVLYITVPYEDAIPIPNHLTFFTKEMLDQLLGANGLKIEYLDSVRIDVLKKHFFLRCFPSSKVFV